MLCETQTCFSRPFISCAPVLIIQQQHGRHLSGKRALLLSILWGTLCTLAYLGILLFYCYFFLHWCFATFTQRASLWDLTASSSEVADTNQLNTPRLTTKNTRKKPQRPSLNLMVCPLWATVETWRCNVAPWKGTRSSFRFKGLFMNSSSVSVSISVFISGTPLQTNVRFILKWNIQIDHSRKERAEPLNNSRAAPWQIVKLIKRVIL